jgi:hypothetical protein
MAGKSNHDGSDGSDAQGHGDDSLQGNGMDPGYGEDRRASTVPGPPTVTICGTRFPR